METFLSDLRYAVRGLGRTPGFFAIAVATVAIGIGATTAIFSAVYAVVLQPFPFPEPDRVVAIGERFRDDRLSAVSPGNFNDWQAHASSFADLGVRRFVSFNVASGETPERLLGGAVTHTYFSVFRIQPLFGRTFTSDEDQPGRERGVVLSHRLWVRKFDEDRAVVGHAIQMDGCAAVCTLAVAMGASTAVFTVIDKVLVRPSPIDSPKRIAVIWSREPTSGNIGEFAYATFRSWQRELRAFESLAAIGSTNWSLILREGEPVTIPVAAVSASFFPLMGTPAARGRTLLPMDDERGAERVAILSHASWVRRFGTDAGIIGRPLRFNDTVYTVVGIMPEGFDYPRGAELWVPVVPQLVDASAGDGYDLLTETGVGLLFLVGRLSPGVPIDAARDEVSGLLALGAGTTFRTGMEAVLTPLDEHIFGTTRPALILLAACVSLVLLIGCANVAVLLLARSATRAHEQRFVWRSAPRDGASCGGPLQMLCYWPSSEVRPDSAWRTGRSTCSSAWHPRMCRASMQYVSIFARSSSRGRPAS